jgi:uncharacterized membrane protein
MFNKMNPSRSFAIAHFTHSFALELALCGVILIAGVIVF